MTDALIRAEALCVTIAGKHILDNVSLCLQAGEIVTVIGPNGAGKTTLLKALMGLVATSAGTITRRPGLTIGYVPQSFHCDRSLPIRVKDFLGLFTKRAAAEVALAQVQIPDAGDKQMSTLSGGEMGRVLLARAIARKPDLLLLDEPTASVDVVGVTEFYHLIDHIRSTLGCGILMISHDLHVVMAKSDRVICLNHHICCEGKANEVLQDPAYHALFGDQAQELALYSHHHRYIHTLSGEWRAKTEADDHG